MPHISPQYSIKPPITAPLSFLPMPPSFPIMLPVTALSFPPIPTFPTYAVNTAAIQSPPSPAHTPSTPAIPIPPVNMWITP